MSYPISFSTEILKIDADKEVEKIVDRLHHVLRQHELFAQREDGVGEAEIGRRRRLAQKRVLRIVNDEPAKVAHIERGGARQRIQSNLRQRNDEELRRI